MHPSLRASPPARPRAGMGVCPGEGPAGHAPGHLPWEVVRNNWLTPAQLCKFDYDFSQYMCIGSSAMSSAVEAGVLRGRPFGGVMILISRKLQNYTKIVCKVNDILLLLLVVC